MHTQALFLLDPVTEAHLFVEMLRIPATKLRKLNINQKLPGQRGRVPPVAALPAEASLSCNLSTFFVT